MEAAKIEILYSRFSPTRFHEETEEQIIGDIKLLPDKFEVELEDYGNILICLNVFRKEAFNISHYSKLCPDLRKEDNLFLIFSTEIKRLDGHNVFENLIWLLSKKISYFLISLQISIPCFVHFSKGLVIVDDIFNFKSDALFSIDSDLLLMRDKIAWPKLENLDPAITWKWVSKYFGRDISVSQGNTQRALFAFANTFKDIRYNGDEIDFIWLMIGIESLYAKGNNAVQEQINEKVQLILGELLDFKKIIKKMYNFRSKFLHGETDIYIDIRYNEDDEKFLDLIFEYGDNYFVAYLILLATFQFMVINNLDTLDFKYQLIQKH